MAGLRGKAEALNKQIEGAGGEALKKQRKQVAKAQEVTLDVIGGIKHARPLKPEIVCVRASRLR